MPSGFWMPYLADKEFVFWITSGIQNASPAVHPLISVVCHLYSLSYKLPIIAIKWNPFDQNRSDIGERGNPNVNLTAYTRALGANFHSNWFMADGCRKLSQKLTLPPSNVFFMLINNLRVNISLILIYDAKGLPQSYEQLPILGQHFTSSVRCN